MIGAATEESVPTVRLPVVVAAISLDTHLADQAAALFQLMEPSFAAGFLGRMRADAAAAILAGLEPDLAYSISVVLAGRNANVPREPVPEARETGAK